MKVVLEPLVYNVGTNVCMHGHGTVCVDECVHVCASECGGAHVCGQRERLLRSDV